jgi:hypothetical protein
MRLFLVLKALCQHKTNSISGLIQLPRQVMCIFFVLCTMPLLIATLCGCACFRDNTPGLSQVTPEPNPMFVASNNHNNVWECIVDAVDDYFDIDREDRIRVYGNLNTEITEGRIDTHPRIAATYLEPWFQDSVTKEERLESTCQTIRRKATVRVVPENGGYLIFVSVYKELEDLERPLGANTGAASFTYTNTINTMTDIGSDAPTSYGWIPTGRDAALEQRILLKIRHNINTPPIMVH